MPIPAVYRNAGEGKITSYSFYDMLSGTGYKTFYGMDLTEVSTNKYALSPEILDPLNGYTASAGGGSLDLDFDLSVQLPFTLKGNCLINVPIGAGAAGLTDVTIPTTIKLYKVSGGVETQLGDTVTNSMVFLSVSNVAYQHRILAGRIIMPTTSFKAGDTIRLSVACTGSGTNTVFIYHAPTNATAYLPAQDTTTYPIDLLVCLPFRVDL